MALNNKQSKIDFSERVRTNQRTLTSNVKPQYDFIVCGSGSSGSVVARRCQSEATPSNRTQYLRL